MSTVKLYAKGGGVIKEIPLLQGKTGAFAEIDIASLTKVSVDVKELFLDFNAKPESLRKLKSKKRKSDRDLENLLEDVENIENPKKWKCLDDISALCLEMGNLELGNDTMEIN